MPFKSTEKDTDHIHVNGIDYVLADGGYSIKPKGDVIVLEVVRKMEPTGWICDECNTRGMLIGPCFKMGRFGDIPVVCLSSGSHICKWKRYFGKAPNEMRPKD